MRHSLYPFTGNGFGQWHYVGLFNVAVIKAAVRFNLHKY